MNWKLMIVATGIISLVFACTKNSISTTSVDQDSVIAPSIPKDTTDSGRHVTTTIEKWRLVKDSVSNVDDYAFWDGLHYASPINGEYIGVPEDYWDFKSDSNVYIHEGIVITTSKYKFCSDDKIVIDALMVFDTGHIVKHTSTDFVVDWRDTSFNGGKYYRRAYLVK